MIGVREGTGVGVVRIEVGDGIGERTGVGVGNPTGVLVAIGVTPVGAGVGDALPMGGSVGAGVPAVGVGGIGRLDGIGVGVPEPGTDVAVGVTGLDTVLEFLQEATASGSAASSKPVRRRIVTSPPLPYWT